MSKKSKKSVKRPVVRPVVFTGVRRMTLGQFSYVDEVLSALRGNVFISGGAPGIDQYVSEKCITEYFPGARHIVVIPWNYKQGNQIHLITMEKYGAEIYDMPQPRRKSDVPELLRNEYMLDLALKLGAEHAKLVAFPGGPQEVIRSGTWTTVRRARDREMPIEMYPLSDAPGMTLGGHIHS